MRILIELIKSKFKWWVAKKEMLELMRWRFTHTQYTAYLEKFKDISLVLKNMRQEVKGQVTKSAYDHDSTGPFDASGLKYRLARALDKEISDVEVSTGAPKVDDSAQGALGTRKMEDSP